MQIEVWEDWEGEAAAHFWRLRNTRGSIEIKRSEKTRAAAIKKAKAMVVAIIRETYPDAQVPFSEPRWCERGCWVIRWERLRPIPSVREAPKLLDLNKLGDW